MKRLALLVVALATAGLLVSASPAYASHEPIPGCKFGQVQEVYPFWPMIWSETFDMWVTQKFVTSNGTCPVNAVRFYLKSWIRPGATCGRVWVRTFNSDGTTRRLYASKYVCAGQNYVQTNVENNRLFRFELRGEIQPRYVPYGSFNY